MIPIELISSIYETFIYADNPEPAKERGTHYTPVNLVDLVFSQVFDDELFDKPLDNKPNVLDLSEVKQSMSPSPSMRFEREAQSDAAVDDTDLGLIDIMVCYTWREQNYLVIECKRIWSSNNSLALRYVRKGVNRFASGKYSAGHAFGAMVGYVLCGQRRGCIKRVCAVLEKEPALETGFDSEYGWKERSDIVPDLVLGSTRHVQSSHANTIELLHSFVDID